MTRAVSGGIAPSSLANVHVQELAARDTPGARVPKPRWDAAKAAAGVTQSAPAPKGRGTVITATDAVKTLAVLHEGDRAHARALVDGLLAAPPEHAVWQGRRTSLKPWTPSPTGSLAAVDAAAGTNEVGELARQARGGRLGGRLGALALTVAVAGGVGLLATRVFGGDDAQAPAEHHRKRLVASRGPSSPVPSGAPMTGTEDDVAATPTAGADTAAPTFNVASFNTLGASHTDGGAQHPTWKSGRERTPGMVRYLDGHDVDVVGLQEFQKPQRDEFHRIASTDYDISTRDANSIAWRRDTFTLVEQDSLSIPYFGGTETDMPVVLLEHESGKRAWFIDIHNPADTKQHHHQVRHRIEALRRESEYIDKLRATGLPVYLVGDFNDRAGDLGVLLHDPDVTPSAPAGKRDGIDWIFATGPQHFGANERDRDPARTKTADHPIVVAEATLD